MSPDSSTELFMGEPLLRSCPKISRSWSWPWQRGNNGGPPSDSAGGLTKFDFCGSVPTASPLSVDSVRADLCGLVGPIDTYYLDEQLQLLTRRLWFGYPPLIQ